MSTQEQPGILDSFVNTPKRKSFFLQPHNYLLPVAILIPFIPYFFLGESIMLLFGRFSVFIDASTFILIISGLLVSGWIIYKLTQKWLLTEYLSWIHIGILLGLLFFFLLTGQWFLKSKASSDIELNLLRTLLAGRERIIKLNSLPGILFIAAQLTFVVNLVCGIISHKQGTE